MPIIGFKSGQKLPPDQVRERVLQYASIKSVGEARLGLGDSTSRALMSAFNLLLAHIHDRQMRDKERYRLMKYFFGVVSSTALSQAQALALLNWMIEPNDWALRPGAHQEAVAILNMLDEEAGQLKLL